MENPGQIRVEINSIGKRPLPDGTLPIMNDSRAIKSFFRDINAEEHCHRASSH
jgi:hypothetical protein